MPDLGAEAVAIAVGEARARVPVHGGRVDPVHEALGRLPRRGDDRVGMAAAVAVYMRDRLVEGVDDLDGHAQVEVLDRPILVGLRRGAAEDGGASRVQVEADAGRLEGRGHRCEAAFGPPAGEGGMHEEDFGRVAGRGVLGLAVDGDGGGHRGLGVLVEVDVADAVGVAEDGDAALGLDARDEFLGAPRHDEVDVLVQG